MGSPKLPFRHRILLIEDDNVSLFAASEILSGLTAMVDIARDVEEAVEQLNTNEYDLVISDISLPDGTGLDIIHYARVNEDSKNKTTPFVALTAHQNKQKHDEILSHGFFELITKPLSSERAYSVLSHCNAGKNQQHRSYNLPLRDLETATEDDVMIARDVAVIDLRLGLQRMSAKHDEKAVIAIGMLIDSLKEDISMLKTCYDKNNIMGARAILLKIRGGLDYSGVPRLQQSIAVLHATLKNSDDMSMFQPLFKAVYEQVAVLTQAYQDLLVCRRG